MFLNILQILWKPNGVFKIIDLQNNYFLIKFSLLPYYSVALHQGPWMMVGYYLIVRR